MITSWVTRIECSSWWIDCSRSVSKISRSNPRRVFYKKWKSDVILVASRKIHDSRNKATSVSPRILHSKVGEHERDGFDLWLWESKKRNIPSSIEIRLKLRAMGDKINTAILLYTLLLIIIADCFSLLPIFVSFSFHRQQYLQGNHDFLE